MSRLLENSFKYDVVLSLNASPRLGERFQSIKDRYCNGRILAATFNHRFYDLYEKNFIKNFTDIHCLDHMMFSMRPSSKQLFIRKYSDYEIQEFKDLSQVVFILQLLGRYDIPIAILDTCFLDVGKKEIVKVSEVDDQLFLFIDKLRNKFSELNNINKQFPMLFSIEKIFTKVQHKELVFIDSFSANPQDLQYDYSYKQINELEKDIFWLGFDPEYKEVPHNKEYPETKWTKLAQKSSFGKGLFEGKIRYCSRCCLPETMEGMNLDDIGICVPCRSSEEKMHINWEQREELFKNIVNSHRSEDYYDCMLPMSGGKDSTYQAHILDKIVKLTPLAVTSGHSWHTLIGRYNLENCLQKFDLDHLFFIKSRDVINKIAKKSLNAIGDSCWHCHIAAGAITVQAALAWDVRLMCWGESIAEADGRGSYRDRIANDKQEMPIDYNLITSALVKAEDMVDEDISEKELSSWFYPPKHILEDSKIRYVHIGDYFFWDEERQTEFIKRNYEWMDYKVENTYKGYKSVECIMAGVHDYFNFIKRGIGRATVHVSQDVKRGLMTREEGLEVAKKYDSQRPHALDYYLKITGYTEDKCESIIKSARAKSKYASKLDDKPTEDDNVVELEKQS